MKSSHLIGTPLDGPVFMIGDSTNGFEFRRFIEICKLRVRQELAGTGRPMQIMVLDNASAHTSSISMNLLKTKFKPLFMPPHR